jgi:hypothetical protein
MSYKVVELQIENHGKINAEELVLDGNNLVASGKTGQGKTTIISVLWDTIVKRVGMITHGEKKESLKVVLKNKNGEKLFCTRKNTAKTSSITIHDEEGEVIPQKTVEKLLESVASNPLSLFELKGGERYEFLMRCSNVDLKLMNELKMSRAEIASERLELHREFEILNKNMGLAEEVDSVDIADLSDKIEKGREIDKNIDKAQNTLESENGKIADCDTEIKRLNSLIAAEQTKRGECVDLVKRAENYISNNPPVDISAFESQLSQAQEINNKAFQYKEYLKRREERDLVNKKWSEKESSVKSIDKEIKSMLSDAKFPVDGLSVDGTSIFYKKEGEILPVLFENLGTSDQILISASLVAKHITRKKGGIHAMRIDRAESMDLETQTKLIKNCNQIGVQLFISVVDRTVKEDGYSVEIVEYA